MEDNSPINTSVNSDPRPTKRQHGRPRNFPSKAISDSSSSKSDDGQADVNKNDDLAFSHNFSFQEIPGVKHCSPCDSPTISYFRLFFTNLLLGSFVKYKKSMLKKLYKL